MTEAARLSQQHDQQTSPSAGGGSLRREIDAQVELAQAGDREAFAAVVRLTQTSLRSFLALRLAHLEMLEEVEQATYVAVFVNLHKYRGGGSFTSWLCGFGRNIAAQHLREHYRHQAAGDPILAAVIEEQLAYEDSVDDRDGEAEVAEQQRRLIEDCIGTLAPQARRLIEARYFREHDIGAIADELGRSRNWVSVNLMRVRKSLRACLETKGVTA